MKRNLKGFSAILTAGIITISAATATMAADIIIAQDINIDVQQNNTNKDTVNKDEEIKKTEETEEITYDESFSQESSNNDDYTNENGSKTAVQVSETAVNETKDNDFNEPKLTDNSSDITETTKDEPIPDEKPIEEETENSDNTSDVNVNIDNKNYVEINNNTGNIYLNIYTGIGVDINNNGNEEADVNVIADNEIAVIGNETSSETQETYSEEIKTVEESSEETTEETTEAQRRSRNSSSRRSSSSKGKSAVLNKPNKAAGEVKIVEDVKTEKEKKVVCMTIGSNLMNIDGKAVETDSVPYISNSYTLVPLRCISTVFDAEVEWDKNTKTAIIKTDDTETRFTINSDTMLVNGNAVTIPKSAEIKNGRTYVPLRALGESLNANVSWIPDSKSVLIIK